MRHCWPRAAATVIVESPGPLAKLLATVPGIKKQVIPPGSQLPPFDVHASVVSLPMLFGTTLETIPAAIPYVQPSPDRVAQWADILGEKSGTCRVGLGALVGNPDHTNDAKRSIPLPRFRAGSSRWAASPAFRFKKRRRKSPVEIEARALSVELIDHTEDLNDFADTAALISQLDLVITVDTSVAHLAGAMGKPLWILITHVPDWRWLLERTDSPWYPTTRLFRQPAIDDWASAPIQEVANELRHFAGV